LLAYIKINQYKQDMEKKRIVEDSFGKIEVPEEAYYGAQTARSMTFFNIGRDKMPPTLIRAYGALKACAAKANIELGKLPKEKGEWIIQAADEVASGKLFEQFPLSIWQTGSGTQTNMNVNEVIAARACELAGKDHWDRSYIHPNDHVNMAQSTNDSFPTAMYVAAAEDVTYRLLPSLQQMLDTLKEKSEAFKDIIKVGRTHLMDATPLTLGQEFSGYVEQLKQGIERIELALPRLCELAIGGTAVGTGLNSSPEFVKLVVKGLKEKLKLPFVEAENKFAALAAHDGLVAAHGAIKTTAGALFKIATDLSWMVSGPRCSFSELKFKPNEPGSSIMPGKFNPTQCEAMRMVCVQVMGNDAAITVAGAMGNFELNVFNPLLIYNFHHSCEMLADVCQSFTEYFLSSVEPNLPKIEQDLQRSLMLVTALNPKIGYDKASEVAKKAYAEDLTLKEAVLQLGYLTEQECVLWLDPKRMV
jgi:fumarate hydratase, class II